MRYHFVICYIMLAAWLCHQRHVAVLQALRMGTVLLALRLSVLCIVVSWLENTTPAVPWLLCAYMAVGVWLSCTYMVVSCWCWMSSSSECLSDISMVSRFWLTGTLTLYISFLYCTMQYEHNFYWTNKISFLIINIYEKELLEVMMCQSLESKCDPEDGDSIFLQNVSIHLKDYTVLQLRRSQYEQSVSWKPQS
jgi:hypothetical protein